MRGAEEYAAEEEWFHTKGGQDEFKATFFFTFTTQWIFFTIM